MGKVLVVGSSNTDMVVSADKMPLPGETILGNNFSVIQGGKGANQAVAAARAGAQVTFIAKVGDDDFGKQAIAGYKSYGIDISRVLHDKQASTGVAVIVVDESTGENSIVVVGGANSQLTSEDINESEELFQEADVLLVQLETKIETVETALKIAKKHGVKTILNPAPAIPIKQELLNLVDILIPNETEAEIISGHKVSDNAGRKKAFDLLLTHVNESVILTLGSKGVVYRTKSGEQKLIKAQQVKAVDTTAAGDVFCGYLASYLSSGSSLGDATAQANKAAAISVTRKGAQPSIPYIKRNKLRYDTIDIYYSTNRCYY